METTKRFKISKNVLIESTKKIVDNFQLSEHTSFLYDIVTEYINEDPAFETRFLRTTNKGNIHFSLKKGLFFISAPGAGKSFIFEDLLKTILLTDDDKLFTIKLTQPNPLVGARLLLQYDVITVYKLQSLYSANGLNAMANKAKCNLYVDDIGREMKTLKHYGNDLPFMDIFIDDRVRQMKWGFVTHASSNLNLAELKESYSSATFSRMFQLFNFIVLDNKIDYRMI